MDAHENEYAGAVAGMNETYGRPRSARPDEHAVGDYLTFRLSAWDERSYDDGRVIGHLGEKLLVKTTSDIVEVFPGEVLPF